VHIQAADDVAMASKATLGVLTHPVVPCDFLATLAGRTPTRSPPFGAGEAQDASVSTLLREIVLILAVFPLAHTLVVVAPARLVAHPMGVPNENRLDPFLLQEAHDLTRRLVPPVADLLLGAYTQPGFGVLELTPAPRASGAARLLTLQLTQTLIVAALETADAPTTHDQSLPCARRHGCQVDLAEINGGLRCAFALYSLGGRNRHVQLVASTPDEGDRPNACGQGQAEAQRLASPAHGQDEPFALACDRLGGPLHCHILLGFIGVAHAGVSRLELPGGFHIGQKLVTEHLNALRVQGELPAFGGLLQLVAIRPRQMPEPSRLMKLAAHVPHPGGFHLCRSQALSRGRGESLESIDAHRLHIRSWLGWRRFLQCTPNMRSSQVGSRSCAQAQRLPSLPLSCKRNGAP
jgi:hypothetical protein